MYLIVGLGNPGDKYAHTRHNIGFDVLDVLAHRQQVVISREKEQALTAQCFIDGKKVMLCKPQTYMNLSGETVSRLCSYFDVEPEHLLVIYDDVDLPQGAIRIRKSGSAGTHNGMRNIVQLLGYSNFPRLRVGIGKKRDGYELADWVLGHYITPEEKTTAAQAIEQAALAVETYIREGIDAAMANYNTKKEKPQNAGQKREASLQE